MSRTPKQSDLRSDDPELFAVAASKCEAGAAGFLCIRDGECRRDGKCFRSNPKAPEAIDAVIDRWFGGGG